MIGYYRNCAISLKNSVYRIIYYLSPKITDFIGSEIVAQFVEDDFPFYKNINFLLYFIIDERMTNISNFGYLWRIQSMIRISST